MYQFEALLQEHCFVQSQGTDGFASVLKNQVNIGGYEVLLCSRSSDVR